MMVLLLPRDDALAVIEGGKGSVEFPWDYHDSVLGTRVHIAVPHQSRPGLVIGSAEVIAYTPQPDGGWKMYFADPRQIWGRVIQEVRFNTPYGFHEYPDLAPVTARATRYVYLPDRSFEPEDETSVHLRDRSVDALTVEWRGFDRWTLTSGGSVWNETVGEWQFEGSSMTEETQAQTRYSLDEAHRIAERIVNGLPC